MRAAINVKHFTRDELCIVQVHHRINDLIDFAHSADGLKAFQKVMGFDFVHRCFLVGVGRSRAQTILVLIVVG
jgi:hypothetical protein